MAPSPIQKSAVNVLCLVLHEARHQILFQIYIDWDKELRSILKAITILMALGSSLSLDRTLAVMEYVRHWRETLKSAVVTIVGYINYMEDEHTKQVSGENENTL